MIEIASQRGCQSGNNCKVIGHYKQMVWAEPTHVGCAAAIGYYDDDNGYPFTTLQTVLHLQLQSSGKCSE